MLFVCFSFFFLFSPPLLLLYFSAGPQAVSPSRGHTGSRRRGRFPRRARSDPDHHLVIDENDEDDEHEDHKEDDEENVTDDDLHIHRCDSNSYTAKKTIFLEIDVERYVECCNILYTS